MDEFRKNLSEIVARVMYGDQTYLVKKHSRSGVVVISEREYENLRDPRKRFDSKSDWNKFFKFTDKIRSAMSVKDQLRLEKIINREIKAIRSKKAIKD